MSRRFFPLALAAVWVVQGAAGQAPAPRVLDLTTPDGTTLKATDFAASKPGPGVMLFHHFNRDRKMSEELAPRLVAAGLYVLTLDFRGYGDSVNGKVQGPARGGPAAGYQGSGCDGENSLRQP